ncbi:hypothetical protein [Nocardia cyriacigeorgica]|uniref:hypothetical protein n=1 Tax=Nocardia cyriacigeorgica TaxID=135487 RepID=UPI00245465C7|nr:hypothetical protein [Nocardia cyriacigeorgica]
MRVFTGTHRTPKWLAGVAFTAALALGPAAVASLAAASPAPTPVATHGVSVAHEAGGVVLVSDTGFGGGFGDGGAGGFGDGGVGGGFGDGGIGGGFGDGGAGDGNSAGDGGFGGGAPDVGLPTDGLPGLGDGDSGIGTLPGAGDTPHIPAPSNTHPDPGQPAPADPVQPQDPNLGWQPDRWPFPDPGYPFSPFFPQSPTPETHDDFDPPCAPGQQGAHCDSGLLDGRPGPSPVPSPHVPAPHSGLPFGLSLPSGSAGI